MVRITRVGRVGRAGQGYSLDASLAMRSKISLTNEFKMAIALFEIPVSGWTCLSTAIEVSKRHR
jgi:hypothetical protein